MAWPTDLAKYILDFVDYGVLVILILIAFEIFRVFTAGGKKEETEALTGEEGSFIDKWRKRRKEGARKEKTKLLNETIVEQKEMDLLKGTVQSAKKALKSVTEAVDNGEIKDAAERDTIVSDLDKLKKDIETAKGEYRKVNKVTWRQKKGFDKLLKVLKKKEGEAEDFKTEDFKALKGFENNILKLHQECADELDDVLKHFADMEKKKDINFVKNILIFPALMSSPTPTPSLAVPLVNHLERIQLNLDEEIYKLGEVYKKQEKVYTEVTAIMSKVKQLW